MKKYLLGLLTGIVILGGIGAVAYSYTAKQVSFTPTDKSWKVKTVEEALTDLRENGTEDKICELKSGEALEIGSMYECNPSLDGTTKYNFYVLKTEGNFVKLIMQRNISDTVGSAKTMNWTTAMNYFRNGAGKSLNWKTSVELPSAQDVADAVGNTGWNTGEKNYDGWFYFDGSGTRQTQVANASNPSAYQWLYNYTRECSAYGCDANTSLGEGYAYAYWTKDIVALQKDTTARAWYVGWYGGLSCSDASSAAYSGVRPVITISKSNVK